MVLVRHGRGTRVAVIVDESELHPGNLQGCVYRGIGKGFCVERTIFKDEICGIPKSDDPRIEGVRKELGKLRKFAATQLVRCTVDVDGLDEIVVGHWLHLKCMDAADKSGTAAYHLTVGERAFDIFIENGGKVAVVEQD